MIASMMVSTPRGLSPWRMLCKTEIDAGQTAAYAAFVYPKNTPQYDPDDPFEPPPGSPHPFVGIVTAFVAFLRVSGGFEIG
jgi:hypothetical protein